MVAQAALETNAIELATELTVAWLSNPNTRASADDVPAFLGRMHQALGSLSTQPNNEQPAPAEQAVPAVSVRKSLASPEHIISMIDGKPYRTLRRHLSVRGMTPEQYRERFGLKPDYPMTSEAYSQVRRDMAKKIGLGGKARRKGQGGAAEETAAPAALAAPEAEKKPKRASARRKAAG